MVDCLPGYTPAGSDFRVDGDDWHKGRSAFPMVTTTLMGSVSYAPCGGAEALPRSIAAIKGKANGRSRMFSPAGSSCDSGGIRA